MCLPILIYFSSTYVNCGKIKAANCQRLFSFASLNIQTNKNYPKMAPKLKLQTIFGCFYEDGMKIKLASDILLNLNISFVFRRDKKPVKTVYHYFYNLNCLVKREI